MSERSTEYSAFRPQQQQQAYSIGYQGIIDAGAMEHTHGNVAYNGYSRVNNRPSYGGNGRGNNHNRNSHMPNNLPAQHYPATHNPTAPAVQVSWNATNYPAVQQAQLQQVVPPYPAAAGWQQAGHPAQFQLAAPAGPAAGQPQAAPAAYYPYPTPGFPAPGYHVLPQHAAVHHQQQHLAAAAAAYGQPQLLASVPAYQPPPPPPQPLMPMQTHHPHQRHTAPTHHHHQQHPQQHPQQQQQQQQQHSQPQQHRKVLTFIDPKTNAVVDLKADTKPKQQSVAAASTAPQVTQQQQPPPQPQQLPQQTAAQQQSQQPVVAVTAAIPPASDVPAAAATSVEEQQQRHVQKDMLTQVAAKVAPSKPAVVPAAQPADDATTTAKETAPVKAVIDDVPAAAPVEPAVIAVIGDTAPSADDDSASNAPQSSEPEQPLVLPAQQQLLRAPPLPLRSQSMDTAVSSGLHHSQSHGQLLELSEQSGPALPGQSAAGSSTAGKAPKYEFKAEKGESDKMTLERKQKYDRAFLFSLQDTHLSTQMPVTLPDSYPELLRKSDQRATFQSSFIPEYVVKSYGSGSKEKAGKPPNNRPQQQQQQQQQQGRAGGGGGTPKYYQQQQQVPKPVVIEMRSREKVDLQHADNAYVPGFRQKRTDDSEEGQRSKDSERNIRSVLNKVTPQNFDSCFGQLTSTCDIGSASGLKSCVDIIFEKAIRETSYSFVFAEICKRLAFLKVNVNQDEESVATGGAPKQLTYRGLLLRKCQTMFETPLLDLMTAKSAEWDEIISKEQREEKKKSLEEEKEEQLKKVKDQYYGNIRFIGELFMKDILTPVIIHSCIKALLTAGDSPTANSATQTEALECLCELLRTVGKKIESASDAKRSLDESFSLIDKIIKKRSIESKVRFKLTDIVEMRHRDWELREMERRLQERPMTKEELEMREREREEAAQKLMAASSGGGRGRNAQQGYGRPPASPSGAAIPPVPTGEWTPVSARRQQKMDTRKLILGGGGLADAAAAGGTASATPRLGPSRPNRSKPAGAASAAAKEGDVGRSPTVQRLQGNQAGGAGSGGRPSRESSGSRDASPRPHHQDHAAAAAPVPAAVASAKASASLMHRSMSTHELPSRAAESGKPGPAILDKDTLTRKSTNIMDEWLAEVISLEDTKTCFREIASHPHLKVFVEANAELLLNAKSKELREKGGRLFFELLYCQLLGFQTVIDGFSNMMENADDWLADFPMLGAYLGEIFSVFLQKSASYLDCVLKLVLLVPEDIQIFSGGCRPLRGEILSRMAHLASVRLGHERVGEAFREAGVDWAAVLAKTPQEANEFVMAQELQFTEAPLTAASTPLNLERLAGRVQETVRRSLPDVDSDRLAESLIDLLERGVPTQTVRDSEAFNQELVRGICGACLCAGRLDTMLLKRLCPVLSRFVEGFAQEVWSLKAAAVCLAEGQADGASDLLSELFTVFLDNRLVSEESFRLWYAEKADDSQRGSVRTFMDTLVSTADSSGA